MPLSDRSIGINTETQWNEKWPKIFDHYQQDNRHAYYVNAYIEATDDRVLEIGAGSFRDMALLNRLGIACWGSDFSQTAVDLARQQFPGISEKIFHADAFALNTIAEKAFDLSFHNGLWVLFNNDDALLTLAKEQVRVSRRAIIATVHNAHNLAFVDYFSQIAETDPLYRIRFFKIDEMRELMLKVCRKVEVVPVGKGKKYYEDEMINSGRTSRAELRAFFDGTKMSNLENSERLLCIGYL